LNLLATPWFWAALLGWIVAQLIKMVTHLKEGRLDFGYLLSTGGMPSAHTSMVCAMTTSIGLTQGFDSPMTLVALAFASVTMFDATNVRHAAGQQAHVLNQILADLFKGHPLSGKRLKELLGHTRYEVFGGVVTGVVVAILVVYFWRKPFPVFVREWSNPVPAP
jgi:acid phosphatase family membrane protein YuiD